MDPDELRAGLEAAGRSSAIDLMAARAVVGDRARRRQRRRRGLASASMVVGALAVIAGVLAVAAGGPARHAVDIAPPTTASAPAVGDAVLPPRADAAITYDAARGQVVLFGGADNARDLADTWLWNGHGWSAATPALSPRARSGAAMAYDPATKNAVLFGGIVTRNHQATLALNDTWTWNGTSWTLQHPQHVPPWSSGLAMSYDVRSHSMLLLTLPSSHPNLDLTPDGVGSRGDTQFGTWSWNGSDWRELVTPNAPLFAKGAVFHGNPRLTPLAHGRGLLFYSWAVYTGTCPPPGRCGGQADPTGTLDAQTWTWDGIRWTEQHPARAPVAGELIVTPGDAAPTVFAPDGRTWTWTGSDWTAARAAGASPAQYGGFAVYDAADSDVVAYAGTFGSDGAYYDTWTWNGTWTPRTRTARASSTTTVPETTLPVTTGPTMTAAPGTTVPGTTPPVTTGPTATTVPDTTAPTTAPASTTCAASQVRLALDRDLGSLMQQPGAYFGLTNTSATACTLEGYPSVVLYSTSGVAYSSGMQDGSSYQIDDPGAHPVLVSPAATVYFGFGWTDVNQVDGGTEKGCVSIARVVAVIPGASGSLGATAPLSELFCPSYGRVTAIAPREAFKPSSP
jgi:hypothetical protein